MAKRKTPQYSIKVTDGERKILSVFKGKYEEYLNRQCDWGEFLVSLCQYGNLQLYGHNRDYETTPFTELPDSVVATVDEKIHTTGICVDEKVDLDGE